MTLIELQVFTQRKVQPHVPRATISAIKAVVN
jgi:hypothetical protein